MQETKGQKIGYRRVSSVDQNLGRQLEDAELDRIFEDKLSGKSMDRPGLVDCLDFLRDGDTLVVHSIDRLARNLSDLQNIVDGLIDRGVGVQFIKENLHFSGDDNPMNKLMLQMMGAFSEFERNLIRERQREGIALAKKQGKKLGRPSKLTDTDKEEIKSKIEEGASKNSIAVEYGISRPTIYRLLAA